MSLKYIIKTPNPIKERVPILLLLHGYGSNEEDLFSFHPNLPEDWIVISFRAPITLEAGGFAWYDINFMEVEKWVDVPQAMQSMKNVITFIEEFKKERNLEHSPVHLGGFSQGGILTYSLSLTFPHLFQKVAIMSSYPEMKLLKNIQNERKVFQHLDFFISHGVEDAVIPMDWAQKAPEFLENLNINFSFREYMSGHGVNPKNYKDLMEFFGK